MTKRTEPQREWGLTEDQHNMVTDVVASWRGKVDDLTAQLAAKQEQQGEWEPVPDGSLNLILKGLERYQRQIGRAELQGWYDTDVARNEIARIDDMLQALRGNEDAPPTLVLCRRKEEA